MNTLCFETGGGRNNRLSQNERTQYVLRQKHSSNYYIDTCDNQESYGVLVTITKYLSNTTACPGFSQHGSQKIWASNSRQSQEDIHLWTGSSDGGSSIHQPKNQKTNKLYFLHAVFFYSYSL